MKTVRIKFKKDFELVDEDFTIKKGSIVNAAMTGKGYSLLPEIIYSIKLSKPVKLNNETVELLNHSG